MKITCGLDDERLQDVATLAAPSGDTYNEIAIELLPIELEKTEIAAAVELLTAPGRS
jgi:hypothetical protein